MTLSSSLWRVVLGVPVRLLPPFEAVLSGILRHQAARVVAAYGAQRLFLLRRVILGDWVTLVLS
ncbi:MAG: hypothetical protein V1253_02245 [Alphaproteobacteria bacterium]|jgi:ribosomal protein L11 methylase PrmA|nr:hypothetical protein [Rhodospirillaceae bacterium]MEE1562015.1 hypothetical protein [Alphaproteobacteria bacterium]